MTLAGRARRRPGMILVACALGFAIQMMDRFLFSSALGRSFAIDEPFVFVVNALLTAMPMIALALQARQHLLSWCVSLVVTAALALWWVRAGIAYQRNPDGSGVDMAGAVVMLIAPFGITAASLWLNKRLNRT